MAEAAKPSCIRDIGHEVNELWNPSRGGDASLGGHRSIGAQAFSQNVSVMIARISIHHKGTKWKRAPSPLFVPFVPLWFK
jgi:hypothetical protein